jgi:linoleoyl-CoA desaturase
MYVKTVFTLGWLAASYAFLVFGVGSWWSALALALSLGLAMAAVGFNIQHDGGHGAYSSRRWVNRISAMTLDLLGASSYIWARKHNAVHHSYTNVTGHDDDINVGVFGRLTPHQKRLRIHRIQHYYLWLLYGFLPIKWHVYDDFRDLVSRRIGGHQFARPRGWDLVIFVGGKAVFFSLALVIPMWFHPAWVVLLYYGVASFVQGLTLSVVFQLAHCVEEAEFPLPCEHTGRIENSWAVHQVETTVDFARENWLLSWFIGGLNFQVEHHLFPQICHVHYAAVARLVEKTCRRFNVQYSANETCLGGVVSHFRWLRRMGMQK